MKRTVALLVALLCLLCPGGYALTADAIAGDVLFTPTGPSSAQLTFVPDEALADKLDELVRLTVQAGGQSFAAAMQDGRFVAELTGLPFATAQIDLVFTYVDADGYQAETSLPCQGPFYTLPFDGLRLAAGEEENGKIPVTLTVENPKSELASEHFALQLSDENGESLTYTLASTDAQQGQDGLQVTFRTEPRTGRSYRAKATFTYRIGESEAFSAVVEEEDFLHLPAATPTPALTATPTPTLTAAPTPTLAATPTPTLAATPTPALTAAPTPTLTATPTPTLAATPAPTLAATPTPTLAATPTPTLAATLSPTPVATFTPAYGPDDFLVLPTARPTPAPTTAAPQSTPIATKKPVVYATPTVQVPQTGQSFPYGALVLLGAAFVLLRKK